MSSALPCSAHSSTSPAHPAKENGKRQIPKWVPISAFVGTSLALVIPLLMVRRRRGVVARMSLKGSTAPPPRKSLGPVAPVPTSTSLPSTQPVSLHESIKEALNEESATLISALSRMNRSSALLAAKAFAVATGLVAVGGFSLIWMVKMTLGIQDAREFGHRMRAALWSSAPSLTSRIHRAPETDDERRDFLPITPFGIQEEWSWVNAEKRLQRAYDEGGFPLWGQAVLRELEAEARFERAKRAREVAERNRKEGAT